MNKKGGNFLEEHAEKIVLVLVGLVCVWLLATRVLFSPNTVVYEGRTFSCGKIDDHFAAQADISRGDLESAPKPAKEVYKSRIDEYKALLDSSVNIADNVVWPIPVFFTGDIIKRFYGIPEIPEVNNISIEHIRAAVYMPTEPISDDNPYSSSAVDINDLDFVTVAANIDTAKLYKNFFENFASELVKEDWRDPCLAVPVFASVELQRQQKLEDGNWTDWQVVPKTTIDPHKIAFNVVEDAGGLPVGGVSVRLVEYSMPLVQIDILQPGIYDIASPQEKWLPPELHKEYIERQQKAADRDKKIKMIEDRDEKEMLRKEKNAERIGSRSTLIAAPVKGGPGGGAYNEGAGGAGTALETANLRREVKEKKTQLEKLKEADPILFDDIYNNLNAILLGKVKNISSLSKLVFWSHDDTVEPGNTYRYRTRIGVFNPIAGTNQFKDEYKDRQNEVVLWSDYSQTSEVVEIPLRLYFYAQSIQETAKTVTVRVFKYSLGYWYARDFVVRAGELIGKVVERENPEKKIQDEQPLITTTFEPPAKVDYSTGAVMLDVVAVKDWGGLRTYSVRPYWEMLYTFDAVNISRMAINSKYWSDQQQVKYNQLQKLEKEEKLPYLSRSGGRTGTTDMYKPAHNPGMPVAPGGYNPGINERYTEP